VRRNLDNVVVDGDISARGLVLRDALGAAATKAERLAAPRGAPADLDLRVDASLDGPLLKVKTLTLQGVGTSITASLEQRGEGLAGLQTAAVTGRVDDLGRLLAIAPPSLAVVPPALRLEGPVDFNLDKAGPTLRGGIVLDAARVRYIDTDEAGTSSTVLDKGAGRPLRLTLVGDERDGQLAISDLALVVDTVKVGGTVSIPLDADAPFAADLHSGAVSLLSLQGLIPPFAAAIGRGDKVAGTVQIDVVASAQGKAQVADAAVALSDLDVNVSGLTLRGRGRVAVKATPGDTDVGIVTVADFDGLSVQRRSGGELTLNKAAGVPLRLDADVTKGTTSAVIRAVSLSIGKSRISGKGDVKALGGADERLALDFGAVDVAFDDLRAALPGASSLPPGGRVKGALSLRGATAVERMALDVRGLDLSFGTSRLQGDVSIDNLDAPRVNVDLGKVQIAFDDLRRFSDVVADLPAGSRFEGALKVSGDTAKRPTMSVDATIGRLVIGESDLRGSIALKNLASPQFSMSTESSRLDVDALRAAFGGGDDDASTPPKKNENPAGLSKATRDLLAGVNGRASIKAARAIVKGMTMTHFSGALVMTRGVARFETLDFGLFGGTVSASGTVLDLPAERTRYDLRLSGTDVDFGQLVSAHSPIGRVFSGKLSPKVEIKGRGLSPGDFAISAEGPAALTFRQLVVAGLDLRAPIAAAMTAGKAKGFQASSSGRAPPGLSLSGFTALTELKGGQLRFQKPVTVDTPLGAMTIDGTTGLDARLDLRSTLQLTPQAVASMTNGAVTLKGPIPVPLRIGGTWDAPRVSGVDVKALLAAVLGAAATDAIDAGKDAVKDAAADAARDAVGRVLGGKKKKKNK
jgi:hypothetical protein